MTLVTNIKGFYFDNPTPNASKLGDAVMNIVNRNKDIEDQIIQSLDISHDQLLAFYNGRILLSFDNLDKLAKIIGSSVSELLDISEK